jgi:molybdopterin molybdotransferase
MTAALAGRDTADVLVTSGGISVGDYDFVKAVLVDLGAREVFWRVEQKPGGPLGFWLLDGKPVFGIPGNTVAAMVCMEEYARPALRKLMGHRKLHRPLLTGTFEARKSGEDGKSPPPRPRPAADGKLVVASSGPQGCDPRRCSAPTRSPSCLPTRSRSRRATVLVHLIEPDH